jgi:hypothetical protein
MLEYRKKTPDEKTSERQPDDRKGEERGNLLQKSHG